MQIDTIVGNICVHFVCCGADMCDVAEECDLGCDLCCCHYCMHRKDCEIYIETENADNA